MKAGKKHQRNLCACLAKDTPSSTGDGNSGEGGDWFRQLLEDNVHFEQDAHMLERVRRVEVRLQAGRPKSRRKVVEIPWLDEFSAFTLTGRYIYISRRIYQLCSTDEEVAFVVAHELAHHDLGHLDIFDGLLGNIKTLPGAALLVGVFRILEGRVYSLEKECEADRHGLRLCARAGYRPEACLRLLDILEEHILNLGNLEAVYGLDEENDHELSENADWVTKLKIWTWHRWRGYLPIRDRRQELLDYSRVNPELTDATTTGS